MKKAVIALLSCLVVSCAGKQWNPKCVAITLSENIDTEKGVKYEFAVSNKSDKAIMYVDLGKDNWMLVEFHINGEWVPTHVWSDSNIEFVELGAAECKRIHVAFVERPQVPWRMSVLVMDNDDDNSSAMCYSGTVAP